MTVRVTVHVEPPNQGGYQEETLEFEEAEFEGKTPAEREEIIRQAAEEWVNEVCPWGFEEVFDDEQP